MYKKAEFLHREADNRGIVKFGGSLIGSWVSDIINDIWANSPIMIVKLGSSSCSDDADDDVFICSVSIGVGWSGVHKTGINSSVYCPCYAG